VPELHSTVTPLPLPAGLMPTPAAVDPAALLPPFLQELWLPPVVPLYKQDGDAACRVVLRNKLVQLHPALRRTTPVWSYDVAGSGPDQWLADDGCLGPTLVVRRGQRVTATYEKRLCDTLPFAAVQVLLGSGASPDSDPLTANCPGQQAAGTLLGAGAQPVPVPGTDALYAWAVTHLHGGRTAAMYDGWTENAMLPPRKEKTSRDGNPVEEERPGQSQVSVYENDQRAAMLWYHDHALGVTRFMVCSGLAGAYVIRDPDEEKRLADAGVILPEGQYDVPLVIQDRNLETDNAGKLTGRLLHKVTDGTAEFFAPYTLVNGRIWPKIAAERRAYRLRMLNGSNARTYCLKLVACDAKGKLGAEIPLDTMVRQIGTDGGLLAAPVKVPTVPPGTPPDPTKPAPTNGLVLAPAERADLFVDFSKAPAGTTHVALVNTAFAPFHRFTAETPDPTQQEIDPTTANTTGKTPDPFPPSPPGTAAPGMRLPYSWVMAFELRPAAGPDPATDLIKNSDVKLGTDLGPAAHDELPPDHGHRLVMLVEHPSGMLMNCEMAEFMPDQLGRFVPLAFGGLVTLTEKDANGKDKVTVHAPVASRFEDRVAFFVPYGRWEVWRIMNTTVDTHPFHIHLVQFRVLSRIVIDTSKFDPAVPGGLVAATGASPLDANEEGWKDTVRVNPNEIVEVAARFDGFSGRYMYHCHILEHEDHEMMRPFVVMPRPPMDVMDAMHDMAMLDGMMGNAMGGHGAPSARRSGPTGGHRRRRLPLGGRA
jgi:spore coat protein A